MKIDINNPCIICGSQQSNLLFETNYPQYSYNDKFIIRKCNDCGLLFNSPRLSDEELIKLYDSNYYFFQTNEEEEFKRITEIYHRTVASIPNWDLDKKVAEVGSGKGYLLAVMRKLGWDVQGIEISSHASDYASAKLNIPTFTGTIEEYCKNPEKKEFQLVLAIDVIEHVPEPIKFLESIDKILSKNGILIIDTPNGCAKNIEYLSKKWAAFNPFHIYFFSIPILTQIFNKMGYSTELSFSYGNKEKRSDFVYDIKKILHWIGLFDITKSMYYAIKNSVRKFEKNVDVLLNNSVETIKNNPNYLQTEDSKDILSKGERGNNIIVIARKK